MKFILQDSVVREVVIEALNQEEAIEKYRKGLIPYDEWSVVDNVLEYVEEEE